MSESLLNPVHPCGGETAFPLHDARHLPLEAIPAEAPAPQKDHYQVFAEELAYNNRNLHARITYRIHWLYRETKVGR